MIIGKILKIARGKKDTFIQSNKEKVSIFLTETMQARLWNSIFKLLKPNEQNSVTLEFFTLWRYLSKIKKNKDIFRHLEAKKFITSMPVL